MARRAAAALAVLLLAAVLVTIWYRGTYHIWPGQAAGSRVHWCGRDYENDRGPASAETLWQAKAGSTLSLRVAGGYPPLGPRQQLLAVSMAGQPAACPTVVFLKTGQDSYLPYSLLGGP
ncbi:MAG TPA: hypothetical protein VGM12_29120 [Trebonia sp.]